MREPVQHGKYFSTQQKLFKRIVKTVLFFCWSAWVLGMVINVIAWKIEGFDVVDQRLTSKRAEQLQVLSNKNQSLAALVIASGECISRNAKYFVRVLENKSKNYFSPLIFSLFSKSDMFHGKHDIAQSSNELQAKTIVILKNIWQITVETACAVFLKLIIILSAFWLWVFAGLLGTADGLLSRYIRTAEGGRESTFAYHRGTQWVMNIPLALVGIYLICPITLPADGIILTLSCLFFCYFRLLTSHLKKYL